MNLAVVGIGLIGGSVARALREAGQAERISAYDTDAQQLEQALSLGVIDRVGHSVADAVSDADLVLLAVPVGAVGSVVAALIPALAPGTVVTDVGSTKGSVIESVIAVCGEWPQWFVPGHPIAGGERFGVAASRADLFRGRRVILTPGSAVEESAIERVRSAWQSCGATVVEMEPQHHDEVLAATSHLPHVLAYALVDCLAGMESEREIFAYAAGGFRDFTRIASSSPRMWHDIVRANRAALLPVIDEFSRVLTSLRDAIERDDGEAVLAQFQHARSAREQYLETVERAFKNQ
ncbi:prephenate dehydrogenase/arogenate dehydrogenase family protein [Algiphilus sp. W345]|uniref:Prephenate dehydrogenase/arogenate dehydrogenase family protein n=1 Tax=Banduia mediterranea TaxID=3075609 RepID=A0ABU2WH93_9GAMM|nr:prephenate dehydrogenase/arogenate dehydrogenase family protein [Algiphilus sp. W345]MDT0497239.1 prephenate dehydrogenase/arogenate dehydrogenase family protein [Algiphilus sp. W345]